MIAILLAIYLVWKLRRDMRKRDEDDRQYRQMIAEAERLQAEEDEAKAAAAALDATALTEEADETDEAEESDSEDVADDADETAATEEEPCSDDETEDPDKINGGLL